MKHSPFVQKNLEAMLAGKSATAKWIMQEVDDPYAPQENVFTNAKGILDWRMNNGKGLFEEMPPPLFYREWTLEGDPHAIAAGATVIVGCNLGYGLNHVIQNTPNSHKVIVLEPNPRVLLACLGQTDYTPFFQINKLFFLPPDRSILETTLRQADVQFLFGKITLRQDLASFQLGPEYSTWGGHCKAELENFSMEMSTLRRRQDLMVGNELANYGRAMADGSLKPLQGKAEGMTVAILGAGPSLADYAKDLDRHREELLLATAAQTLPALQELGVKPHLAFAIDFNPQMMKLYNRLDPEWAADIPLLYSAKLNPEVVRNYPGPTLPLWTQGGLATFMLRQDELVLDASGNVSVGLMRFLSWCGAERFILAGQDFAWKGENSHVRGHHAHARSRATIKDKDGNELNTTMPLITAQRDLEKDIRKGHYTVFNLYGGGAVIKGAEHLTMPELDAGEVALSEPGRVSIFLRELEQARQPRPMPAFEPRARQWSTSLKAVRKRLEKLFKKPDKNRKEIFKTLVEVHAFLRQDPLYLPYVYNQVMDVAGMVHLNKPFVMADMVKVRNIFKTVQAKVREMDQALAPDREGRPPRANQAQVNPLAMGSKAAA